MLLAESTNDISREFRETLKMDPRINISWGDWMIEEDTRRREYFLNLSNEEWENVVRQHLAAHKVNLRPALAWTERVQQQRLNRAEAKRQDTLPEARTTADIMLGAWKDMVEEPWKYSDEDWSEWLEMDESLQTSSKRWRVAAFWQKKQDEADEVARKAFIQVLVDAKTRFDNRMAIRIQAAWRGHKVRDTQPQLSCGKCLARAPARYENNGTYMCGACAEEAGPCAWCRAPLDCGSYCDDDCELSARKDEAWADRRWGGW
jgi:hypothetical protein